MNRPCIRCGELTEASPCPACATAVDKRQRLKHHQRANASTRGYDTTWRNLSERARRAQPWCTDCGATQRLSLDHLPSAWERHEQGLPLRLAIDVQVVCARCNSLRGSSRPGTPRAQTRGDNPRATLPTSGRWGEKMSQTDNHSQEQ